MKKKVILVVPLWALSCLLSGNALVSGASAEESNDRVPLIEVTVNASMLLDEADLQPSVPSMWIKGTGQSEQMTVNAANLAGGDITVTVSPGFEVSPKVIASNSKEAVVTVKLTSTLNLTTGIVTLRSGDVRKFVNVYGHGSPLVRRSLSENPVYAGKGEVPEEEVPFFPGFSPGANGYTVEMRVRTDNANQFIHPFASTPFANGFKGFVDAGGMGLYNSWDDYTSQKALTNPATSVTGGSGAFYNTDGQFHTYRYSVTSDKRVFVYRDGLSIDTLRLADLAMQPEFAVNDGNYVENLLCNPHFEGEWNARSSDGLVAQIEGWNVYPLDQYNSLQSIIPFQLDNVQDYTNHVLKMERYLWSDGWSAGQISQIVDVSPNEVYDLRVLAKGGLWAEQGPKGSIRMYDLQDSENTVVIPVTSDDFKEYTGKITTGANTKQVKVEFYLDRCKWGSRSSDFVVDDVYLEGRSREYGQFIGFSHAFAEVDYFTFDDTGAYAPLLSLLACSADSLTIDGTGSSERFTLHVENLVNDVTLDVTSGFEVSPSLISASSDDKEVTVTLTSTLMQTPGELILRSGDLRQHIPLLGYGSPLVRRSLSESPDYVGKGEVPEGENAFFPGFSPGANGYTVEMRVRTDNANQFIHPFASTPFANGFKGFVDAGGMGLYNSWDDYTSQKALTNPATSVTGGSGAFYNTDGQFHTYRYSVTSDKRVFVYRDGLSIDTLRLADLAMQPEFAVNDGNYVENLLRNPHFEGEWNARSSDGLVAQIEGWNVYPLDQYNSLQSIIPFQLDNAQDYTNHVLKMERYLWSDGWSAGQISQIVDVSPNEVYDLRVLAKGGLWDEQGPKGSIRMYDLQDSENTVVIPVTSDDFKEYTGKITTGANTKQVKVEFYLDRCKWGSRSSDFVVDDVYLEGRSREYGQFIGFSHAFAEVDYFTFDDTGAYAPLLSLLACSADSLTIDGTGSSERFTLHVENLVNDVTLDVTSGFEVSPSLISASSDDKEVTVTLTSTLMQTPGELILRSGDLRQHIPLLGYGSPLVRRSLSESPDYVGKGEVPEGENAFFPGFSPGANGYTVEMRVRTDNANQFIHPFASTPFANGFKGFVDAGGMGLYNSWDDYTSQKALTNPATSVTGGSGAFYNTDGQFHTYRYSVTSDKRVFVYRDGLSIDTLRLADLAMQPEFAVNDGNYVENLLRNPHFEGEWNARSSDGLVAQIEGWNVYPLDQYNSLQSIIPFQLDNAQDYTNHVLKMERYLWSDGWSAGQISQIVDVSPNEVYDLRVLAKGGLWDEQGPKGSIRMYDLQDSENTVVIPVTSDDFKEYTGKITTGANTKQVKVEFYLDRCKWGSRSSDFVVDDVYLEGRSREYGQFIGFSHAFAEVDYFTFDDTGAYAPLLSLLACSADSLTIDGTGSSERFTLHVENLVNDVTLDVTSGFEVSPSLISASSDDKEVTVTLTSTLMQTPGELILRSGDLRQHIPLLGYGSPLVRRSLSESPDYVGKGEVPEGENAFFPGFSPGANGYTVEMRVRTDNANQFIHPFASTPFANGFKGFVDAGGMGLYNSWDDYTSQKALTNPATSVTGGSGAFYNTDGQFHTYRYSVTSDKRVFVYRDGLSIDTLRLADLAMQPEFAVNDGNYVENLLRNPHFEGEWNARSSDGLVAQIEGWNVYPLDQYNSLQSIIPFQLDNVQDYTNHVLKMERYLWSDGWSAGQISQIVDVSPNEVYDLRVLAKGGLWAEQGPKGSIRMYDLQDSENTVVIPVTSDDFKEYTGKITTGANTKQVKVEFYLDRCKWGSRSSDFVVDDVYLEGRSREYGQFIGFSHAFAEVDYFTFDDTGAYAPLNVALDINDITEIEKVEQDENTLYGYVSNGMLYLNNLPGSASVRIYKTDGTPVFMTRELAQGTGIGLPSNGVYICVIIDNYTGKEQMVKVSY